MRFKSRGIYSYKIENIRLNPEFARQNRKYFEISNLKYFCIFNGFFGLYAQIEYIRLFWPVYNPKTVFLTPKTQSISSGSICGDFVFWGSKKRFLGFLFYTLFYYLLLIINLFILILLKKRKQQQIYIYI